MSSWGLSLGSRTGVDRACPCATHLSVQNVLNAIMKRIPIGLILVFILVLLKAPRRNDPCPEIGELDWSGNATIALSLQLLNNASRSVRPTVCGRTRRPDS